MRRLRTVWELLSRFPTVLRTLAHLDSGQARAQIHHALFGLSAPRQVPVTAAPPTLAISEPRKLIGYRRKLRHEVSFEEAVAEAEAAEQ